MAIIMHLSKKKLGELMASNTKEDHTYITPEGVINSENHVYSICI